MKREILDTVTKDVIWSKSQENVIDACVFQ